MAANADYIVVGGGSAGCVVASRLSEDPDVRVCLVEAGGSAGNPAIWRRGVGSIAELWRMGSAENWGHASTEQAGLGGRVVPLPRGKVLGGSSAINAMLYVRGHRRDFDGWCAGGAPGWSYRDVLPYFKRSEHYHGPPSAFHGRSGPMSVVDYQGASPVSHAFIEAAGTLGATHRYNDFNGESQDAGAGFYQSTRRPDGTRVTAATAFLGDYQGRPKLDVLLGNSCARVVVEGGRAVGVDVLSGRGVQRLRAEREVILCAGAFETPKLLLLSGIGPPEELRRHDLPVCHALPGVGRNLQDHLLLGVVFRSRVPLQPPALLAEAGLFTFSDREPRDGTPDLQYLFGPLELSPTGPMFTGSGFTFAPILVKPESRGRVTLASNDPRALAQVDPAYLTTAADVGVLVSGIRYARELAHTPAFADLSAGEVTPGPHLNDAARLAAHVRAVATTVWHPAGTCRMGNGADAVVDEELRVWGIEGLRVADASIMPTLVTGNPNAAVMMIAEKASDLVRRREVEIPIQHSHDIPDISAARGFDARLASYRARLLPMIRRLIADRQPKKYLYTPIAAELARAGGGLSAAVCLATCRAFGGDEGQALPSAAALELLGNARLAREKVQQKDERDGDLPLTVNLGNALEALSAQLLRENRRLLAPRTAAAVLDEFDRLSLDTLEDRARELGWTGGGRIESTERFRRTDVEQTSSPSFVYPTRIGALIAQPERPDLDRFTRLGHYLGLALSSRHRPPSASRLGTSADDQRYPERVHNAARELALAARREFEIAFSGAREGEDLDFLQALLDRLAPGSAGSM